MEVTLQRPRHIREKVKAKVIADKATYQANEASLGHVKGSSLTSNGRSFNTGFRFSPRPTISHRFSIHPGRDFFTHNSDQVLTNKQRKAKYRLNDAEFYDIDKLNALVTKQY